MLLSSDFRFGCQYVTLVSLHGRYFLLSSHGCKDVLYTCQRYTRSSVNAMHLYKKRVKLLCSLVVTKCDGFEMTTFSYIIDSKFTFYLYPETSIDEMPFME